MSAVYAVPVSRSARRGRSSPWVGLVAAGVVVAAGVAAYLGRPPIAPPPGADFVGRFEEMAERERGEIVLTFRVPEGVDRDAMILRLKQSLGTTLTVSKSGVSSRSENP